MKMVFEELKYVLYTFVVYLRWFAEVLFLRFFYVFNKTQELELSGVSLILLPHIDDEWIGCSGAILSGKKIILCDMNMPGGDDGEVHSLRKKELGRLSEKFKIPIEEVDNDNNLEIIIQRYRPRFIFVPYFIDWHEEHQHVISLLNKTLRRFDSLGLHNLYIMMYQVSVPILPSAINITYSMSYNQWRYKWDMFTELYPSQRYISYNRFRFNEIVNGFHKSFAAEPYCCMPYNDWYRLFENWKYDKTSMHKILNNLSSLVLVRLYSCPLHFKIWSQYEKSNSHK